MTVENKERIGQVVDYIEDNIKNDITLEAIAQYTYLSKYHLHRIFKHLTNKSIMEYVRGRKLSSSIIELLKTDLSIIDIAYEYNYNHEQSYIRSFKNMFSTTPSQFRKKREKLVLENKIDINIIHSIFDQMVFEPEFVFRSEFNLIGIEHKIYHNEDRKNRIANKVGYDFYYNKRMLIKNVKDNDSYYSLVKHINIESNYYIPSIEVYNLDDIPEGMVGNTVPDYVYAVFKYIGLHPAEQIDIRVLSEIYRFIFGIWFPKSEYNIADGFHIECIKYSVCREDYCEMDIYVPIEKI